MNGGDWIFALAALLLPFGEAFVGLRGWWRPLFAVSISVMFLYDAASSKWGPFRWWQLPFILAVVWGLALWIWRIRLRREEAARDH